MVRITTSESFWVGGRYCAADQEHEVTEEEYEPLRYLSFVTVVNETESKPKTKKDGK